jgi:hypothetical protein
LSDLWQVGGFFHANTLVFSTKKTDHHDIAEIWLKVALNTNNSHHVEILQIVQTFVSV